MRRVLITGGLGFIGSNLIRLLLREQPELQIVNLDCLAYAANPQNLAGLADDPRYSFVKGNICDRRLVEALLSGSHPKGGGFDGLMHLAAESMVDRSIKSSEPFIQSNVLGTQVLLDSAMAHGLPRFLMVSTDEVYGSLGSEGEFTESSPLAPNNPYAASKASADLLCRACFKTHGLCVICTRCSNNYGPRQFPEKLIPLIISRALRHESLPVYGDGLQVRDWLFVDDHCRALWLALTRGEPGQIYNIGGGQELSNLDLVRKLLELLDRPESLITHVTDRPGHDRRYAIDSSKAQAELGWRPQVDFADGLKQTVDWYVSNSVWLQQIADGSYQQGY